MATDPIRGEIAIRHHQAPFRVDHGLRVEALLAGRGIETVLFDRCRSNPVLEDVEEGVELCRSACVEMILHDI